MAIILSLFNNKTEEEFMKSSRESFNHETKTTYPAGTRVILKNQDSEKIFGIAILGEYENGKAWRDHHPLDIDIYSGEHAKYNKYDYKIDKFKKISISYDHLRLLIGIDAKKQTNLTRRTHLAYRQVFVKQDDEPQILEKLSIWIESILNSS
jgi:hypothetical protein